MKKTDFISSEKWSVFKAISIASLALSMGFAGLPAYAQDKADTNGTNAQQTRNVSPSDGLSLNLNGLSPESLTNRYEYTPLDLPAESVGSSLFKLDLSNPDCLTGETQCLRRDDIDLGISKSITALSQTGIDFTLTPRASLRFDDDGRSALVGAVIEIGEDLREGSDFDNNTWYFFAGADAEALTYSPNSVSRLTSGQFHLQDRIIVGDAQAGLGYRLGDTDVSLSYMRREATAEDFSFKEDAAALSFTWKR